MLLWQEVIVSSCGDPIAVLEFRFGLCDESTVSVRNSMKIYGLLGLLVSLFSIGSLAEAQVITGSFPQNCPNCSSAVRFPSAPAYTDGSQVIGQPIYEQPIYQDSSVVPATYVAPAATIVSHPVRSTSYFTPTVSRSVSQSSTSFGSNAGSGLAQSKAARAARMGLRGHLGGGLGGARYEGVGLSLIHI